MRFRCQVFKGEIKPDHLDLIFSSLFWVRKLTSAPRTPRIHCVVSL